MEKQKYAIVDIETTGGMYKRDKITEIAVILYDGETILDKMDTLVNPERSIPPQITRITGITNDMVSDAPKFFEVAKRLIEITKDAVFVAHNVGFDYNFIRNEYQKLGYTYTRKQLCTVKLSRKAFPGLKSYSLGNLIRHFDLEVENRHRAYDDAFATTDIFGRIINGALNQREMIKNGIRETKLPDGFSTDDITKLPSDTGVYYFHNEYGHVIYVGKSINIQARVKQHFNGQTTKSTSLLRKTKHISFELTGNELIALLFESVEIKRLQPEINRAQKTKSFPYFVHKEIGPYGYVNFKIEKSNKKSREGKIILSSYSSKPKAKAALGNIRERYNLCISKLDNDYPDGRPCIYRSFKDCSGACTSDENTEDYNVRANIAAEYLSKIFDDDFFLVLDGKDDDDAALILVENGYYRGYGYILKQDIDLGVEEMKEAINYVDPSVETNKIIAHHIGSKNDFEMIKI